MNSNFKITFRLKNYVQHNVRKHEYYITYIIDYCNFITFYDIERNYEQTQLMHEY